MGQYNTTVGEAGDLMTKALRSELRAMVKSKLQANIDDILEDMAKTAADNILASIETMTTLDDRTFGPTTKVVLNFALKNPGFQYDPATKEVTERTVLSK